MVFGGCFSEDFVPAEGDILHVSLDTIRFDTVFTTIGSVTKSFTVKNNSSQNVIVDRIFTNPRGGMFRMNVDGVSTNDASDIRILANDSIYVFVEVTVNPDADLTVSPYIIEESIIVDYSERRKTVILEAFGQNANYISPKEARGSLLRLSCNNGVVIWDDPKPYIVNGILFIDSCTVVVPPGARVFTHGGQFVLNGSLVNDGALIFLPTASLQVLGTIENPVVFQADRLEPEFRSQRGQWSGIRFLGGDADHRIENAIIKNSIIGVRADSATSLAMRNVMIFNTASVGVVGINATITMDNCIVHSNETQSCLFAGGGSYSLRHCTLANFQNRAPALYMDNFTCLDADCRERLISPLNITVENSIIVGSNDDEIEYLDGSGGRSNVTSINIFNSLLRIRDAKMDIDFNGNCIACLEWANEQLFSDLELQDFTLQEFSVARNKGKTILDLDLDIRGVRRDADPDLGCYEFDQ